MRTRWALGIIALACLCPLVGPMPPVAAEFSIGLDALHEVQPGDVLRLLAGTHQRGHPAVGEDLEGEPRSDPEPEPDRAGNLPAHSRSEADRGILRGVRGPCPSARRPGEDSGGSQCRPCPPSRRLKPPLRQAGAALAAPAAPLAKAPVAGPAPGGAPPAVAGGDPALQAGQGVDEHAAPGADHQAGRDGPRAEPPRAHQSEGARP